MTREFLIGGLAAALLLHPLAATAQSLPPTHGGFKINGFPVPSTAVQNYTFHMNMDVPSGFSQVRVRLFNASPAPVSAVKAIIAVTATADDGQTTPSGGNGSWKAVTVNGASAIDIPAAIYSAGNQIVPSYVDSDLITLASLPKSGGEPGAFVMFREESSDANQTVAQTSAATPPTMQSDGLYLTARISAAGANTPPGPYAPQGAQNSGPAASFQFYTTSPAATLLGGGDSIMMGTNDGNVAWQGGYMSRLARALTEKKGKPVYLSNYGHQSLTTQFYLQNVLTALQENTARAALYAVWSPNDPDKFTFEGNEARKARVQTFIRACQAAGTRPVLVTPFPVGNATETGEAVRREMATYAKSLGVPYVDFDRAFTNYASQTGGWLNTAYTSDTGHLTAAGYDYAAEVAYPAIAGFF